MNTDQKIEDLENQVKSLEIKLVKLGNDFLNLKFNVEQFQCNGMFTDRYGNTMVGPSLGIVLEETNARINNLCYHITKHQDLVKDNPHLLEALLDYQVLLALAKDNGNV